MNRKYHHLLQIIAVSIVRLVIHQSGQREMCLTCQFIARKEFPSTEFFAIKHQLTDCRKLADRTARNTVWSDNFEIAWTKMGNKGPFVLFLHGVSTNRAQWEAVQGQISRFCETISIDMLGDG